MLKVAPAEGHPLEPGCYLRGNDYSPVAVVILMNDTYSSLPPARVTESLADYPIHHKE